MGDERGGWKGLDTAFLRDHLHAATAVGRMAAAARAVELGYGIVADPGPSGRLGAIAGIPTEVCEIHSTRSAPITASVGADASYASRSVAARGTRERKTKVPVADLMASLHAELTGAGHPPADLAAAVTAAGTDYHRASPDLDQLAGELLSPGGRLAGDKTFTRGDVVIAVAPHLHGLPLSVLDRAVDTTLAHPDAIALPVIAGAREEVWAAGCVLADEERIASLADALSTGHGPAVSDEAVASAVAGLEEQLGGSLTDIRRRHQLQTAAETLAYELWALLLADEGLSDSEIQSRREAGVPFKPLLSRELASRLGGQWDLSSERSAVGRYWTRLYLLRNRIVHAGHPPHDGDAEEAEAAFVELDRFLDHQLRSKAKRFPKAARAKLEGPGTGS